MAPYIEYVPCFEEIVYDVGRRSLAEQQAYVAGIQQRAGALVAVHALIASFLGTAAIQSRGLTAFSWVAIGALAVGLSAAAVLLFPWKLAFALDARTVVRELDRRASAEAEQGTSEWLTILGLGYQRFRERNAPMVKQLSLMAVLLGTSVIVQALGWLLVLVG